ncbi:hypothetical protein SEA_DATBOI_100 [Gordonia phage DatBoi]|nr:hypothetical protein SEA_DATBOI_100 [Gordonia phage DatBoi]
MTDNLAMNYEILSSMPWLNAPDLSIWSASGRCGIGPFRDCWVIALRTDEGFAFRHISPLLMGVGNWIAPEDITRARRLVLVDDETREEVST